MEDDDIEGDTHIVPLGDFREHDVSATCWCRPTLDEEMDRLWIHHAMDQRELWESGERLFN